MRPVLRGRICGYKHVRRAVRTRQRMLLACGRTTCTAYSENFGWPFSGRICRLPIGLGSLWAAPRRLVSHFAVPNVWHRKRDCGGDGRNCAAVAHASRGHISAHFWPQSSQSDNSGRQPAVASDPPGWTCVLYLRCKPRCQTRHFGGQPQGEFWQADQLCKRFGQSKTGTGNREVGAIAPLRLAA